MSIIKSIKQTDFTVIITTKSGIVRTYTFDTTTQCNQYYNDITSYDYTKSVDYITNIELESGIKRTNFDFIP